MQVGEPLLGILKRMLLDEVLKQITVYKNGKVTKYDLEKQEDEFGGLCEGALTIDDCDGDVVSKETFYTLW